ncbi:hypothetical protein PENTCL1PPCAC_16729, partial [Pristionchus entomophagus]
IALVLCLGISDESRTMDLLKIEFHRKFDNASYTGWIVFAYKKNNSLNIPAVFLVIFFNLLEFAFIFASSSLIFVTYNYVSIAFALSPFTKGIHSRLLATVSVQTLITIICITIPSICNMTLPIFDFSFPFLADITGFLGALSPNLQPLFIILLTKSYRRGFLTVFSRNRRKDNIQSPFLVTVS